MDTVHHADHLLVARIAASEQAALAEAYRAHGGPALGLAQRLLNDRSLAEEVVQEVFLRLWDRPDRYDAMRGSLRSFLLAHVHGRSVDLLRAERSRRSREERDARRQGVVTDDLERAVVDLTVAEAVRGALATLSPPEREAIELAYFGGHSYRDVAQILETPEGTVKSRIRTGMLRLRAALIEAGVEGVNE